jgi:methyl-accepting chemotaxis protein
MGEMTDSMSGRTVAIKETSEVMEIIDETALQANLLALNLAIVAAQAGQSGVGFTAMTDAADPEFSEKAVSILTELVGKITCGSAENARCMQIGKAGSDIAHRVLPDSANAEQSFSATKNMSVHAEEMEGFVCELLTLIRGQVPRIH